ncbi:MAG: hypothetical protein AB7D30_06730 [Lysobacteraceae bacterium]
MESHSIPLLLALAPITLVPPAVAQPARTHGHEHASAGQDAAFHVPADHVRWAPDAALLEGMIPLLPLLGRIDQGVDVEGRVVGAQVCAALARCAPRTRCACPSALPSDGVEPGS